VGEDEVEHVLPGEAPPLAEDLLDPGVVTLGVVADALEAVVGPLRLEAGHGAGGLADVILAVALPQREQLHQLARVVLVRRLLVGVGEREEQQHGRVDRDVAQQLGERAERAPPEQRVLAHHQRRVLVGDREVVVPEQGHLLHQGPRGADHPVQPPQGVVAPLVVRVQRFALDARRRPVHGLAGAPVEDPAQGGGAAALGPGGGLVRARAEAGAPEEAADVVLGPGDLAARRAPGRLRLAAARAGAGAGAVSSTTSSSTTADFTRPPHDDGGAHARGRRGRA
jgi:hypothetical protein